MFLHVEYGEKTLQNWEIPLKSPKNALKKIGSGAKILKKLKHNF